MIYNKSSIQRIKFKKLLGVAFVMEMLRIIALPQNSLSASKPDTIISLSDCQKIALEANVGHKLTPAELTEMLICLADGAGGNNGLFSGKAASVFVPDKIPSSPDMLAPGINVFSKPDTQS